MTINHICFVAYTIDFSIILQMENGKKQELLIFLLHYMRMELIDRAFGVLLSHGQGG